MNLEQNSSIRTDEGRMEVCDQEQERQQQQQQQQQQHSHGSYDGSWSFEASRAAATRGKECVEDFYDFVTCADGHLEKSLGNGSFGIVFEGKLRENGAAFSSLSSSSSSISFPVAIKIFSWLMKDTQMHNELHIMDLLRQLDIPNVVKVLRCDLLTRCTSCNPLKSKAQVDHAAHQAAHIAPHQHASPAPGQLPFLYQGRPTIVMEKIMGGELLQRVLRRGHFSEKNAANIIKKLSASLAQLHANGIMHRDLKPENLMFRNNDEDSDVVILDFGLSAVDTEKKKKYYCRGGVGSRGYHAPEVITDALITYTDKVDMWQLGTMAYILLVGFPPFALSDVHCNERIKAGKYYPLDRPQWAHISEPAKDLIRSLLEVDPAHRLSAEQVLAHPWIAGAVAPDDDFGPAYREKIRQLNSLNKFQRAVRKLIFLNRWKRSMIFELAQDGGEAGGGGGGGGGGSGNGLGHDAGGEAESGDLIIFAASSSASSSSHTSESSSSSLSSSSFPSSSSPIAHHSITFSKHVATPEAAAAATTTSSSTTTLASHSSSSTSSATAAVASAVFSSFALSNTIHNLGQREMQELIQKFLKLRMCNGGGGNAAETASSSSSSLSSSSSSFSSSSSSSTSGGNADGVDYEDGPAEKRRKTSSVATAFAEGGVEFEEYCKVLKEVGLHMLAQRHIFDLIDVNRNGLVDQQEFLGALTALREPGELSNRLFFHIMDKDGDSKVSKSELHCLLANVLDTGSFGGGRSGADGEGSSGGGNGGVGTGDASAGSFNLDDFDRYEYGLDGHAFTAQIFADIDRNEDGEISLEEFLEWIKNEGEILFRILIDPIDSFLGNSPP